MSLHDSGVLTSFEADAWSTIADAYPAMLYIASHDGAIEWINRRCYDVTGVPRDIPISEFWHTLIHPSHESDVRASWERSVVTGEPFSEELLCRFADGEYHWVCAKAEAKHSTDSRMRWFGTIVEVDDRKEIERALLKAELRFRALTDNLDQIVWVADADWNCTYLSRRAAEYTGLALPQALGTGWRRAVAPSDIEFLDSVLAHATTSGQLLHEYQLYHAPSGKYRWNLMRAHRVTDLAGNNAQWFGTVTDVHEQKVAIEKKNEALDAFQLALLPRQIAAVPDCGVSTLYVSASEEARIGGDWYDCFDLGEGRYGISIGDVVGHGLEASAAMSRIRQYISAAAEEESDPVTVIRRVNAFMHRRKLPVATAIVGILDVALRRFEFCCAGHPPPVIVRGDRAELIPCDGVPLGVVNDVSFAACSIDLADASQLVLYTDGVLEYSRDIVSAERYLLVAAAVTARLRNPASRAAEIVRRTMGAYAPNDDIAMLVFSFDEGGGSTVSHRLETLMSWQFDSRDSRAAYRVREQVLQFLRELSSPEQELFEVKAVIGELIANAVEHAPGDVHLEVDWSGDRAVLRMRDHGPGFTAHASLPRDVMSEDGRGLYLISALADDLRASSHFDGGTEVSVRLRLHKHNAA